MPAAAASRSRTRTRCSSPTPGYTKLDLVHYYLAVAEGALRGVHAPADGAQALRQRRRPRSRSSRSARRPTCRRGSTTAHITFPSGRSADLVVCDEPADLAWVINLGCIDLNPWPVRADDVDHPDELRVDLDPTPEADVRARARGRADGARRAGRARLSRLPEDLGLARHPHQRPHRAEVGVPGGAPLRRWPSGARSSAACPALATTAWWKEERHGVFIDYNQNARDRTVASAYSVRPTPDARVSCPLDWDEVPGRRARRLHASRPCRARFARARRPGGGNRRRALLARAAAGAGGAARARRPGRRAVAAAVPQGRRASPRASSRASGGVGLRS